MATYWVQVLCCIWQDRCDIVGCNTFVIICILYNLSADCIEFPHVEKKRLELPIKATNLVIIIKWSIILGIDLKTALNQTVTFKWHLQLWRRTFSDWVCSLPIIKRCGSQNDCNFPDYDEIKYYIGYWCNKCFKTNDYLLLTPPFSNGEHFLDWVRSLPITKRCGSPYQSN